MQGGQTSIACSSHTFGDVLVIYSGNITTTSQHCSLEGATFKNNLQRNDIIDDFMMSTIQHILILIKVVNFLLYIYTLM